MAMTTVTIVGNVTRDPELKFTNSGLAMCTFGLAVNNRRKDESIPKGTTVIVTGKLRQRSWEADDGSKRSKVEVNAEHVGPALNWSTCEVTRNERKGATEDVRPGEEPF
jgi:single-strand DNA-binding protein